MSYDPKNWYWLGTPNFQTAPILYSSKIGSIVPTSSADYIAWSSAGNLPSPWPRDETGAVTTAALDDLLTSYDLQPTGLSSASTAQLFAYADAKVGSLLALSRNYSVPEGVISCDGAASVPNLTAIQIWGTANPTATQKWIDNNFAVLTLTGADAVTFANAVLAYGQSVYAMLAAVATGITGWTITTTAQIDAEAWPV